MATHKEQNKTVYLFQQIVKSSSICWGVDWPTSRLSVLGSLLEPLQMVSLYTINIQEQTLVLWHRLYSTVMDPWHILTTFYVSTNSWKVSFVHICSNMCCICFIHDYSSQWSNMECQGCVNFISCGFIHMFVIILWGKISVSASDWPGTFLSRLKLNIWLPFNPTDHIHTANLVCLISIIIHITICIHIINLIIINVYIKFTVIN